MDVNRTISVLTTVIAEFVSFMAIAGDLPVFAENGTESVPALQSNLPLFLVLMVGAGVISSITFIVVVSADLMRRRRQKKYSCIQHLTFWQK